MSTRFKANQIELTNQIDNDDLSNVMVLTKKQVSNEIIEVETGIVTTAHRNLFTYKELYTSFKQLDDSTKSAIEASETSEINYTNAEFQKLSNKESENFFDIDSSLADKTNEVESLLDYTSTHFEVISDRHKEISGIINQLDQNLDNSLSQTDGNVKSNTIDVYISDISDKFVTLKEDIEDLDEVRIETSKEVYSFISENTFVLDTSINFTFDKYKKFSSELEEHSTDVVVTYDVYSDNIETLISESRYKEDNLSERIEKIVLGNTDGFSDIEQDFIDANNVDKGLYETLSINIFTLDKTGKDNEKTLSNNLVSLDNELEKEIARVNLKSSQFLQNTLNNENALTKALNDANSSAGNLEKYFMEVGEGSLSAENAEITDLITNRYVSIGQYWRFKANHNELDIEFNPNPTNTSLWESIPFMKNNNVNAGIDYVIYENSSLNTSNDLVVHTSHKPSYSDALAFLNSIHNAELRGEIYKLFHRIDVNALVIPSSANESLFKHSSMKKSQDSWDHLLSFVNRTSGGWADHKISIKMVKADTDGSYKDQGERTIAYINNIKHIEGNLAFIELNIGNGSSFNFDVTKDFFHIIWDLTTDDPDLSVIYFPYVLQHS